MSASCRQNIIMWPAQNTSRSAGRPRHRNCKTPDCEMTVRQCRLDRSCHDGDLVNCRTTAAHGCLCSACLRCQLSQAHAFRAGHTTLRLLLEHVVPMGIAAMYVLHAAWLVDICQPRHFERLRLGLPARSSSRLAAKSAASSAGEGHPGSMNLMSSPPPSSAFTTVSCLQCYLESPRSS